MRIVLVALAAGAVWLRLWEPLPHVSVLGLLVTVVGGWPILAEALENLRQRRMTMELSMTIALAAALAIGEAFTALVITLFVLIAEALEGITVSRGRRAIEDLLSWLPRMARVRSGDEVRMVSLDDVRPGDVVLVDPGGRLPVDGVVETGHSFVDEAAITGESLPVEKVAGSPAYAGTINQSGALEVRAQRLGRDTSFGKIVEAVERAERSRAPVQKLADRLAGQLVYFALGAATLTFIVTRDARSTISVVIVAGACGIAAGTPLAVIGAIGRAAKIGAIVKGGLYLEALSAVDTVVLDKTGTLTYGMPEVRRILPASGVTAESLMKAAALAEMRSEHPLGKAIVIRAREMQLCPLRPDHFAYVPGRGIAAKLGDEEILAGSRAHLGSHGIPVGEAPGDGSASEVWVARGGRYLGRVDIADTLRPTTRAAVSALRDMGLRTLLLTGDRRGVAEAIGRELEVDEVQAELLPDGKVAAVKALEARGKAVAMVGDGINDAPALASATVGIAMGSGTDVARESASIVLLGNDLLKLVEAIRIARRARRVIMQNFAGTLAVDGVGIGLAAAGFLNPLLAAFIHVASELAFILNSARLLPGAGPAGESQAASGLRSSTSRSGTSAADLSAS